MDVGSGVTAECDPSWFCVCSLIFTTSIGLRTPLIAIHDSPPATILAAMPSLGEGIAVEAEEGSRTAEEEVADCVNKSAVYGTVNGAVIGKLSSGSRLTPWRGGRWKLWTEPWSSTVVGGRVEEVGEGDVDADDCE